MVSGGATASQHRRGDAERRASPLRGTPSRRRSPTRGTAAGRPGRSSTGTRAGRARRRSSHGSDRRHPRAKATAAASASTLTATTSVSTTASSTRSRNSAAASPVMSCVAAVGRAERRGAVLDRPSLDGTLVQSPRRPARAIDGATSVRSTYPARRVLPEVRKPGGCSAARMPITPRPGSGRVDGRHHDHGIALGVEAGRGGRRRGASVDGQRRLPSCLGEPGVARGWKATARRRSDASTSTTEPGVLQRSTASSTACWSRRTPNGAASSSARRRGADLAARRRAGRVGERQPRLAVDRARPAPPGRRRRRWRRRRERRRRRRAPGRAPRSCRRTRPPPLSVGRAATTRAATTCRPDDGALLPSVLLRRRCRDRTASSAWNTRPATSLGATARVPAPRVR